MIEVFREFVFNRPSYRWIARESFQIRRVVSPLPRYEGQLQGGSPGCCRGRRTVLYARPRLHFWSNAAWYPCSRCAADNHDTRGGERIIKGFLCSAFSFSQRFKGTGQCDLKITYILWRTSKENPTHLIDVSFCGLFQHIANCKKQH